jgi:hypothetical protein
MIARHTWQFVYGEVNGSGCDESNTHASIGQVDWKKETTMANWRISYANYDLLMTLHHRKISTIQIMGMLVDFHSAIGNLSYNTKDAPT